jgi:hypothetical protein
MMNNSQAKPYFSIIVVIGCILAISLVVIFSPPARELFDVPYVLS